MDSYQNTLVIKTSPDKIFHAITTSEGLSQWWTPDVEIYSQVGGTATFRFEKDMYVVMKISKILLNKEVIWKCVEQQFVISGTDKTDEWVGTMIKFDIKDNMDGTSSLIFTHAGLNASLFCYKECSKGWDHFLHSLQLYLETGKGTPSTRNKE